MRFSFSNRDIDRLSEWRTKENLFDELLAHDDTRIIVMHHDNFLITGETLLCLRPEDTTSAQLRVFLGVDKNSEEPILLHVVSDAAAKELVEKFPDADFMPFKELGISFDLNYVQQSLCVESLAISHWHDTHQYCPQCGSLTMVTQAGWSRTCLKDGRELFPKIEPSIMALIVNDKDEILLANDSRWVKTRYSLIAGFVDAGETIEQALHREVKEEVGVELTDVQYIGDQTWPFPASLMFGFKALAVGDIKVDGTEILDAKYFSREDIVRIEKTGELQLPRHISMSRQLIDAWLKGDV